MRGVPLRGLSADRRAIIWLEPVSPWPQVHHLKTTPQALPSFLLHPLQSKSHHSSFITLQGYSPTLVIMLSAAFGRTQLDRDSFKTKIFLLTFCLVIPWVLLAVHIALSQLARMSEWICPVFIKNSIMTNILSQVTEQLISIQLISSFLWYFFCMWNIYSVFLSTGICDVQTKAYHKAIRYENHKTLIFICSQKQSKWIYPKG